MWINKRCTCRDAMKSILPRRVEVKYLDRIHGRSCILLLHSNSVYFPRSLKISSVYDWNSSRSSCTGGKFYELSTRKWARFAKTVLSTTSNWSTLILCNLGNNRLCFLIKYSVFSYYQLSFNINSRCQTLLAKTWYFKTFYVASVKVVTLYSLPPKFTIHSCLYVPKFIHRTL